MLNFFRRIRKPLIESGKTRKYLLYASGEVLLVMVGIILALQVNNWNQSRIDRISEVKLLNQLKLNLLSNKVRLLESIELEQKCAKSAAVLVEHLDEKRAYHDSLKTHLSYAFYSGDIILSTSAYEAIKSKGFDNIRDDFLRNAIIELFDANYASMLRGTIDLEDLLWPSITLPKYIQHLRLDPNNGGFSYKIQDYDLNLEDASFISMVEYRGSFRTLGAKLKKESLKQTLSLIQLIEKELAA